MNGIFGFQFNLPEFIFGLIVAAVVLFLLFRMSPAFLWIVRVTAARGKNLLDEFRAGAIERYRREMVGRAETMHLARAIFALDEIAVEPRLLVLPPPPDPSQEEVMHESTLAVLPSLPDWVLLSGVYRAPTMSIGQALSSNDHLLITGRLGSGKTSALAYLAILAARRDPRAGPAVQWVPVLIHAADLRPDLMREKDPLEVILAAAGMTVSTALASRLPGFLRNQFRLARALLLLDGLDELARPELAPISDWLRRLAETYPGNHIVAAGPASGYDGLTRARLAPIPLAPWGEHEQRTFLRLWSEAWKSYVVPSLPRNRASEVDLDVVNGWLIGAMRGAMPLEVTLRAWAAHAGDARGQDAVNDLEAFVARFLSQEERPAAEATALTWINERKGAIPERALHRATPIGDLVEAGVLSRRIGSRVSFYQPAIGAYLAARAMIVGKVSRSATEPGWLPAETAMRYYAAMADASTLADEQLHIKHDPLESRVFLCARWLQGAPLKAPWRPSVLRALGIITQDVNRPFGLRLRAVHALVGTKEPSVAILFRRLLASTQSESRVLACLGLGGLRDTEAVSDLQKILANEKEILVQQAACLALAGIGNTAALEVLGKVLLGGKENIRLAVAEALACEPEEGYAMLRDAIELDNLLTRRAAVFGLARVPEAWAEEVLQKVQLEDSQWVVRGAAAEALEHRRKPSWKIRAPAEDPSELGWVVAYAAKQGLGVGPGGASIQTVRKALKDGTMGEKAAALDTLAWTGDPDVISDIIQGLRTPTPYLRDVAYEALWRMSASGLELPSLAPA
jgi:HEAT repeat protein